MLPNLYPLSKKSFVSKANLHNGQGKIQKVQASNFTIHIQNTNATLPEIFNVKLENIAIQNDTAINFSVDFWPTALEQLILFPGALL